MTVLVTAAGSTIPNAIDGLSLAANAPIVDIDVSIVGSNDSSGDLGPNGVTATAIVASAGAVIGANVVTGTGSSLADASNNLNLGVTDRVERIFLRHLTDDTGSVDQVELAALKRNSSPF